MSRRETEPSARVTCMVPVQSGGSTADDAGRGVMSGVGSRGVMSAQMTVSAEEVTERAEKRRDGARGESGVFLLLIMGEV